MRSKRELVPTAEPEPPESDAGRSTALRKRRFRLRILGFGLLALGLTAAFLALDIDQTIRALGVWMDARGWWAGPIFIGLHALAVVTLVPGAVFPLMAGFLFGPALGAVYAAIGKTVGAWLAFCIARYLIGGHRRSIWLAQLRARFTKLAQLENRIVEGGWKSLATARLIPAIPFKLSSYLFGWTQFTMRDFVIGTLLGTIPYSITNAYLGSLAADLGGLGKAPVPTTQSGTVLYAAAALIAVVAAVLAGVKARRFLRETETDDIVTGNTTAPGTDDR